MFRNRFLHTTGTLVLGLGSVFAHAAGSDSGTASVADLDMSGGQFLLLLGGVAVVGIVLWLVVKMMNR